MRKETTGSRENWYFESWGDFVNFSATRKPASCIGSHIPASRKTGDDGYMDRAKWTGTRDFAEAQKLAIEGWPEGASQVKALAEALLNKVTTLIERQQIQYDVTGNDFDISLVNEGIPECWYRFETDEVQSGAGTKIIRFTFNCCASAGVSAEVLIARGSAAAALVEALEYAGFRVEITLYDSVGYNNRKSQLCSKIPVKEANQPLDRDRLAFTLAHPSVLRRLCFGAWEGHEEFMQHEFRSGYGNVIDITKEEQGDVHISSAHLNSVQWSNPESAVEWILEELKRQGVNLSEEVPA
jgi:hypothetical protein